MCLLRKRGNVVIDNLILLFDTALVKESKKEAAWVSTHVSNLIRYVPSGIYFARVRVGGKLFRESLKTDVFTVAQLRLGDFIKDRRVDDEGEANVARGKLTFGDALSIYKEKIEADPELKPNSKLYRRKCIIALLKSWPGLETMHARKVSEQACEKWARHFASEYSPSVYNNTLSTLRQVLAIAIKMGARYGDPTKEISRRKPSVKNLTLPSQDQFHSMIREMETAGGWCSRECADLVRFISYGGFRKDEASNVTWGDCDFEKGLITVTGNKQTGTKNGEVRKVPMITEQRELLDSLRSERRDAPLTDPVMKVRECQKAIDRAVIKLGIARFTHHDLRHLFATRCIESGVDIPTVSRWLGHKDGGALAMKVYGHLRDEHSSEMARRVSFSKPLADNILPLPKQEAAL